MTLYSATVKGYSPKELVTLATWGDVIALSGFPGRSWCEMGSVARVIVRRRERAQGW